MAWAGRDDLKDYVRPHSDKRIDRPDLGRAFFRHLPTGLEIWGALDTPYYGGDRHMRFQFGPGQSGPWLVTVDVAPDGLNDEIRRIGFDTDPNEMSSSVRVRYRKLYGYTYRLTNFMCEPSEAVLQW